MNDDHAVGPRNLAAMERAVRLIPGGVNSPARAFGAVGGSPLFIQRASGAYLFDLDGRRLVDYIGSWGPMILGHAHPEVVDAIAQAASRGTSYGAPTEAESELAERIIQGVPSIEKVRLVSSGTEATMSALRVARGFTGRSKVIKFAGNYHGHVDALLVASGSAAATLGVPNSPGVTAGTAADTIVLPYNNVPLLVEAFDRHRAEIAAVILEPVVGNMGCVLPQREFLETLRGITKEEGSVLIFDEVMTGFRLAFGGAQERFQIIPDMTTLGKIVGGGLPLGAYGGREEIMNCVLPVGKVFQAGTLSGNPVAVAAGNTTLRLLAESPPYAALEHAGAQLAQGLASAAASAQLPHCVQSIGSMLTLFFHQGPVLDWSAAAQANVQHFARFFWGMIERGFYFPCSQYEALFLGTQHTAAILDQTIDAAHEVCKQIAES